MFKMDFNYNFNFPDLNLERQLKHIAERIIVPEIAGHIASGTDINGVPYPPLADITIKMKNDDRPLIGKDRLLFSSSTYSIANKGKNKIVIGIKQVRKEVAKYLQIDGVRSKKYGKRFFNFFGINKKMEREAVDYMKKEIYKVT